MRIDRIGQDRPRVMRDVPAALLGCVHMGQSNKRAGGLDHRAGSFDNPAPASETEPRGRWPDDPDEIPEWRLKAERRAAEIGVSLPGYRTRRQFDAAVAKCTAAIEKSLALAVRTKLSPKDAAARFANHVLSLSQTAAFSSEELTTAYAEWMVSCNVECSESHMRGKLKRVPAVTRETTDTRMKSGRRVREVRWVFRPPSMETVMVSRVAA